MLRIKTHTKKKQIKHQDTQNTCLFCTLFCDTGSGNKESAWMMNQSVCSISRITLQTCKVSGIQDSRLWEKLFESQSKIQDSEKHFSNPKPWVLMREVWIQKVLSESWILNPGLGQNLESWIQKTVQTLQRFMDPIFYIQVSSLSNHIIWSVKFLYRTSFWKTLLQHLAG